MSASVYQAVYDFLRMSHYVSASGTWDSAALKAIAAQCYAVIADTSGKPKQVVITSSSSEAAGAAAGEIRFPADVVLQAVMDLLREVAPDSLPPEAPSGHVVDFSRRYLSL